MYRMSSLLLLVCAGLLVSVGHASSVDLTLTDKANGTDVVEAVVDLIQQSCIFDDDRLLLRRIAYVETQDGVAANTFKNGSADFYGGIWQVSSSDFTLTKTSASQTVYGQIKTVFSIDWSTVQYTDLVKPLYSGLAARLKIDAYYRYTTIPQSVQDQAAYWAQHYTINTWGNTTYTVGLFVAASAADNTTCSSPKADIVFVLDGSGSITATNFANVLAFVQTVVSDFDVGPEKVRIGLIEFSATAVVQFNLTTYNTSADILSAIGRVGYFGSDTNTADAIAKMQQMIQQQGRQQDGVPVIVIFLTDGQSNDPTATAAAANSFHTAMPQVTVFAVGVGSGVNINELDVISSNPSCIHVFLLSSFSVVTAFTDQIMKLACKVPAKVEESDTVTGSLAYNQYYYFSITAHRNANGVTIKIKASSGGVKMYFSWKVRNPSPAIYDFIADVNDLMQDGATVTIPWDDSVIGTNSTSSRRRRSTDADSVAPVYGAVVGVQQKQNDFALTYTDAIAETTVIQIGLPSTTMKNSATRPTTGLLMMLIAVLLLSLKRI